MHFTFTKGLFFHQKKVWLFLVTQNQDACPDGLSAGVYVWPIWTISCRWWICWISWDNNNQTLNIQVIFCWETSRCQKFWKMNIFNVFGLLCSCHCVHLCPPWLRCPQMVQGRQKLNSKSPTFIWRKKRFKWQYNNMNSGSKQWTPMLTSVTTCLPLITRSLS